jgi:transcriptional regulator with XRE-family HTH domain
MPNEFAQGFAQAVRRLRSERGVTQAELAQRLGLGRTSVTNIENGDQIPSIAMLPVIANALGVEILELVAEAASQTAASVSSLTSHVTDPELRRWTERVISEQRSIATARPKKARSS